MKRVFIVHGWEGYPEEGWFPWLKAELEKKGFGVVVPAMPHPEHPTIEDWVSTLTSLVPKPDSDTYFVGHSIGCQAILRYLAGQSSATKIGGLVFVAPWISLTHVAESEQEMVKPWLTLPIDTKKVMAMTSRIVALFSPTDKWVPLSENEKWLKEQLHAQTMQLDGKGERGHFSGADGVVELPEALSALVEMTKVPAITIDDFAKVEIKMGKILTAERIEGSDKLLKLSIDVGPSASSGQVSEIRTICSGVAQFYSPEQVIGKMVPVITNLAPRKMKGIESNGMVMFGIDETGGGHVPIMLNPEKDLPPGSPVQ